MNCFSLAILVCWDPLTHLSKKSSISSLFEENMFSKICNDSSSTSASAITHPLFAEQPLQIVFNFSLLHVYRFLRPLAGLDEEDLRCGDGDDTAGTTVTAEAMPSIAQLCCLCATFGQQQSCAID